MKKVIIFLLVLICASSVLGQQQKVAIYVTGSIEEGVNDFVGAYLVDAIVKSSNYLAVERTADFLKELNKEQGYQRTGAVDDDQISKLGKQFGVQLVCVAKIVQMGGGQFVSARLIDVETATVKSSTKPVTFTIEDIDKSCAAIAISLISGETVDVKKPMTGNDNKGNNNTTPIKNNTPNTNKLDDVGVEINGLIWATCNVGEQGTFVSAPQNSGNYYRWGGAYRACPAGWRLPTQKELDALKTLGSKWTSIDGVAGRQFGSGENTIFLPATGYYDAKGYHVLASKWGVYWSSTYNNSNSSYQLSFSDTGAFVSPEKDNRQLSVRCVREK